MRPSLLHNAPSVVPVIFFMLGIGAAQALEISNALWIGVWLLVILVGSMIMLLRQIRSPVLRPVIMNLLMVVAGYLVSQADSATWNESHFQHRVINSDQHVEALVTSIERYGTVVHLQQLDGQRVTGSALIPRYALSADSLIPFKHTLRTFGKVRTIRGPRNPAQFDFSSYCATQGYAFEFIPVKSQDIHIGKLSGLGIRGELASLRNSLLHTLEESITDQERLAVAKAILLGDRTSIDADQRSDFQEAGLAHILAISGLHVGTVYLFLITVFSFFFPGRMDLRIASSAVILGILWLYYTMSGCSISAGRATLMFSVLELSNILGRGRYSKNALALAALMTLVADPQSLYAVGFQLSYLAVFGILLVHKPLVSLWAPPNRLLKGIWSLFMLTLAAQLLSFPLILYYFHQFSFLSFLTGVLIVPLTAILIQSGFLFLIFSAVPIIGACAMWIFQILLSIVVKTTEWLPNLLPLIAKDIWIDPTSIFVLAILMFVLVLLVTFQKWRFACSSCLLLLAFLVSREIMHFRSNSRSMITFYHLSGNSLASIIEDGHAVLISFNELTDYELNIAHQNLSKLGVHKLRRSLATYNADSSKGVIHTDHDAIALQSSQDINEAQTEWLWVVDNGWKADFSDLLHRPSIVIDGSVAASKAYALERRLLGMNHQVINLWRTGGKNMARG